MFIHSKFWMTKSLPTLFLNNNKKGTIKREKLVDKNTPKSRILTKMLTLRSRYLSMKSWL